MLSNLFGSRPEAGMNEAESATAPPPEVVSSSHLRHNNHADAIDLTDESERRPPAKSTTVDGTGMWRSWTRVFAKPESACLDLLDNCFDAAALADRAQASYRHTRNCPCP